MAAAQLRQPPFLSTSPPLHRPIVLTLRFACCAASFRQQPLPAVNPRGAPRWRARRPRYHTQMFHTSTVSVNRPHVKRDLQTQEDGGHIPSVCICVQGGIGTITTVQQVADTFQNQTQFKTYDNVCHAALSRALAEHGGRAFDFAVCADRAMSWW
eukprot:3591441-Rhodomonas_salina.2